MFLDQDDQDDLIYEYKPNRWWLTLTNDGIFILDPNKNDRGIHTIEVFA